MEKTVFRCCTGKPLFFVQYAVAGFQKNYLVCSDCIKVECFSKYIIKKIPIDSISRKKFQNEISDEIVENEITDGKTGELIDENENLSEHNKKVGYSQHISKNKENENL